jgi:hypothetical protein
VDPAFHDHPQLGNPLLFRPTMTCDQCGDEIPSSEIAGNVITDAGRSLTLCQACLLDRYSGGGHRRAPRSVPPAAAPSPQPEILSPKDDDPKLPTSLEELGKRKGLQFLLAGCMVLAICIVPIVVICYLAMRDAEAEKVRQTGPGAAKKPKPMLEKASP